MKKNKPSPKEIYQLWWEYLKRSKKYNNFCKTTGKKKEQIFTNEWFPIYHQILGDVHSCSFNEWWEKNGKGFLTYRDKLKSQYLTPKVKFINYSHDLRFQIDLIAEKLKKQKGGEPSAHEVNMEFRRWLGVKPTTFYIKVDINGQIGMENLRIEFGKFMKPKIDALEAYHQLIERNFFPFFSSPIHSKSLEKYLEIYDKKYPNFSNKKLTIRQLSEEYYPEFETEIDNPDRIISEIIAKAKKIINNVECGIFPGPY